MSARTQYADAFDDAVVLLTSANELWTQSVERVLGATPAALPLPLSVDAAAVLDPIGVAKSALVVNDLAQRVLEINREYVQTLAGAMTAVQGIVREQTEALTAVVRDGVSAAAGIVKEQADTSLRRARVEAESAQDAERAEARRREVMARDAARDAFADHTKAELQDELARRDLPKTGNVEELRSRLIDHEISAVQ